jgi:hypothetical protein
VNACSQLTHVAKAPKTVLCHCLREEVATQRQIGRNSSDRHSHGPARAIITCCYVNFHCKSAMSRQEVAYRLTWLELHPPPPTKSTSQCSCPVNASNVGGMRRDAATRKMVGA